MAKTWQVVLATIAIFVAGAIAGGATSLGFVRYWHSHAHAPAAATPGRPKLEQFGPQLMKNFIGQLDLSEDQRARIMPIVHRTAYQLSRERREVQLSVALTIEQMQDEIARQLNRDQRARFEELIAAERARLQELRRQPPPAAEVSAPTPTPLK